MVERVEFYQSHLDRVSRSFAFCIRQLPLPLREWVGLSYLLCRIVDTIEDAAYVQPEFQFEAFTYFDRALLEEVQVASLKNWMNLFSSDRLSSGLPEGEQLLLHDAALLMADYHAFPPAVRDMMRELIHTMSLGMQHFCRLKKGGSLRLANLAEVNQYCFFVAGLVGELLANLCSRVEPKFQLSQATLLKAYHFGLFLQKVNLLKDQVGDEKEGRHLIPSRELVEESSRENAVCALEFLLALPKEQIEFRRFCAWSLFLGLEALRVARRSLREKKILKVSRQRTEELLFAIEPSLSDDLRLRQLFESQTEGLGWSASLSAARRSHEVSTVDGPGWLLKLYHGCLDTGHLCQLGV